ncbi:hypothetical protein S7711_10925 [Stachybotrys chartarum IBT 7711]|uniref:MARVEL domain-containing protein n=1 Tax=Stachybotrys chartarum (strain CBS 109288 / IBT 7711) TaxID=1280523 RepID=A0A084B4M5_STACB|nr:hypothetical protein S7711_10925 [Stachybotrys chartarum IBT 7711]KFA48321.1 hypothetical protein S40293_10823 [Stachybotrys chartarum IBT 40293]KFA77636.1 hypothetical protein S40288_11423 [Stachybotrys chartarum IBT 40288]
MPRPPTRFDRGLHHVLTIFRTLGWLSALGAFLIQAYTIQRWSSQVASAMPGLVASVFAMLNDSLYLASRASCLGERFTVPGLTRTATILWDVAALLVSAGDLILPVAFTMGVGSLQASRPASADREPWQEDLDRMGMISIGVLAGFRLILVTGMCLDRERVRQRHNRAAQAPEVEQVERAPSPPPP